MSPNEKKIELFRALEVNEVEQRAQHIVMGLESCCPQNPGGHGNGYPY